MGTRTLITDKKNKKQARILKRNIKKYSDAIEKSRQLELKIKPKENQLKILPKVGRLKSYQNKTKKYIENRTFQNNENISTNN